MDNEKDQIMIPFSKTCTRRMIHHRRFTRRQAVTPAPVIEVQNANLTITRIA